MSQSTEKPAAHTPGPWSADRTKVYAGHTCQATYIADANPINDFIRSTAEANANLIAAAPELLAALMQAEKHLRHQAAWISKVNGNLTGRPAYSFESLGEDMPGIESAIAKATGKQS